MALDVERLRRSADRYVARVEDREDIAQEAILIALERGGDVTSSDRQLLSDAMRRMWGLVGSARRQAIWATLSLDYPPPWDPREVAPMVEGIASLYPSDEALLERWHDELDEDHADEWRRLPAATRDQRRIEAMEALGTSCERLEVGAHRLPVF